MNYLAKIKKVKDGKLLIEPNDINDILRDSSRLENKEVEIYLADKRSVTANQRAFAFALIQDIASSEVGGAYAGIPELIKQYFYQLVEYKYGSEKVTLSHRGNMTDANYLIDELIEFVIAHDIPLSKKHFKNKLIENNEKWEYLALLNKFDVIDGTRPSDLHHIDTVGMGNNRNKIDHVGKRVVQLSRTHHNEAHNIGWTAFSEKYKLNGTILTPYLAERLGLK